MTAALCLLGLGLVAALLVELARLGRPGRARRVIVLATGLAVVLVVLGHAVLAVVVWAASVVAARTAPRRADSA